MDLTYIMFTKHLEWRQLLEGQSCDCPKAEAVESKSGFACKCLGYYLRCLIEVQIEKLA